MKTVMTLISHALMNLNFVNASWRSKTKQLNPRVVGRQYRILDPLLLLLQFLKRKMVCAICRCSHKVN